MSIGFIKKMRSLCRLSVYFLCTGQRNRVGECASPTASAPGTRQLWLTCFLRVPVCIKKEDCSVLLDHMYLQVVKIDCLDKVV